MSVYLKKFMADPLFTFGVTTYNRIEMLKECLTSILRQTSPDFEVIVGNDYTADVITNESLGISDSRIRIVNHPRNLGEVSNMNYLLSKAKGRYFSWLADDDLVIPQFVEAIHTTLEKFSYPACVFTSYNEGLEYKPEPVIDVNNSSQLMNGDEFLQQYLSRTLKLIGCYGGIETKYLKEIGGIEELGDGFSPYADNLLAIRAGKLDKVAYVDAPLIFFRTHDQSLSYTSCGLTAYTSAQQGLLSRCEEIFEHDSISHNRQLNMFHLLIWCSRDIYSVLYRGSSFLPRSFINHLRVLDRYARGTGWLYPRFLLLNLWFAAKYLVRRILKNRGQHEASDS